jgi:hypothetical protein
MSTLYEQHFQNLNSMFDEMIAAGDHEGIAQSIEWMEGVRARIKDKANAAPDELPRVEAFLQKLRGA